MQTQRPILTITGSDPTGNSGVQADLKTITALGGCAVCAITSITVQNTLGIQEFHDLPATVVEGQIEAIVNDVAPWTVKIGMIRTMETLRVIVSQLRKYHPRHIVYMPVMQSAQGECLMSAELVTGVNELLLPLCTHVIRNEQFINHGEANRYASAVAYYLNEGTDTDEAQRRARQLLDAQPAPSLRLLSRSEELYTQFVREVEQSFRQYSDVRYYADRLNVAGGYLAQVTRRLRGLSPKAVIYERIMTEAERLLRGSDHTVQEIAYALGFSSQAHFAKFFKKQKGISPTQYRKE